MTTADADEPEQIAWQGKWITAKTRGRWEYVSRARNIRAAVIVPIDGDEVVLIDQYRVPLGKRCLEFPAGLIGDEDGAEDEDALASAKRELEEDTGYRAGHWRDLGEYQSSPGMVTESFTLLLAQGLERVGEGGGLDGEDIVVHRIKIAHAAQFVAHARASGMAIDVKIILLLAGGWLEQLR